MLFATAALAIRLAIYFSRRKLTAPRAPVRGTSAHEVLGVAPDASVEEIHRAYQQKIREYHPDRVATMGPELRALAERRTKEINAAYKELCERRGAS